MELSKRPEFIKRSAACLIAVGSIALFGSDSQVSFIENGPPLGHSKPVISWRDGRRVEFYNNTVTTDSCVGSSHIHELSIIRHDNKGEYYYNSSTVTSNDRLCQDGVITRYDFLLPFKRPAPAPAAAPKAAVPLV